jgi:hypothetical protein
MGRRDGWGKIWQSAGHSALTSLDVYPYLPRASVGTTSAASYMCLIAGGSA